MDSSMVSASTAAAQGTSIRKSVTGAQLILKTLDKLNTGGFGMNATMDAGYQFRKDVLSAAGIGNKLDALV